MDGKSLKDIVQGAEEPKRYKFEPDTDDVIDSKGDLSFMLVLQRNIDPNIARQRLGEVTSDMGFGEYLWISSSIVCRTDKDNYEDFFTCEVEYDPSKAGQTNYTHEGYKPVTFAKVPDDLADVIKNAHLNLVR